MILKTWMMKYLKMFKISQQVVNFITRAMENCVKYSLADHMGQG